ncbi:hypothetical protein BLA29_013769 [Euroglyphus maynei]|uniref:Uncharacterized protein n=1 Tax=Euroglyphus maynei TaxID=6958 RepID=A0A1Y3BKH3_EURMA|nr:hypothetical protein BLA29_013769 [Euroglyphus maynei]
MPSSTQELNSDLLDELPDDIRREVIGYARQKSKNNQHKETSVTPKKTSKKPKKSPVKHSKNPNENNMNRANDIFFGRIIAYKMLDNYLKNGSVPQKN